MSAALIIVAAGTGSRLSASKHKAWVLVHGRPLWWHALQRFRGLDSIRERVLVVHAEDHENTVRDPGSAWLSEAGVNHVVVGGARRMDSVLAGIRSTSPVHRDVLVHDAARPLVNAASTALLLQRLESESAVILVERVTSTVKEVDIHARITRTIPRDALRLATTPQGGRRELLLAALERAQSSSLEYTDEASVLEAYGVPVSTVLDPEDNIKVTTAKDLEKFERTLNGGPPRIGHGYDIHRLVPGRPLILGGVTIPSDVGLLGHSDGDALLHAIIEALLGAAGLGDIGEHFPDTDPRYLGADSAGLLRIVLAELAVTGLRPLQVDCSLIAEKPRLGSEKARIKANLVELLGLPADRIAVKARSAEGLDALGRGEALAVHCIAMLSSGPRS